eukprot:768335-Hanusia_phi.AAC.4
MSTTFHADHLTVREVSDNRMQMIGDVRVEFQMWLSGKITMTADAKFVKVSDRGKWEEVG